ncbi:MAG: hypothetical protein RTU30_11875 [Candidatus Thorarchaeota archaeon]
MQIFGIPVPYFVIVLESVVLIALIVGWIYGSRRMDFNLHHRAVWFVALVHMLTVGLWMIPRALERLSIMLNNPIVNWYQIVHDIVGILAIALGVILVLVFLIKKGMPLKLLKRTRPLMFLTIAVWVVAFILGAYWFMVAWVWI